ncbi:MAG: IS256 family transposase [Bacteroidia bacterium]|nr:IS256 family transposase [Bacteroidia bacterium]
MKLTPEMIQKLEEEFANAKTYNDLMGKDGVIKKLIKESLETMLKEELTEHLGYEKHSSLGNNSGNSRNGSSPKSIRTDNGEIDLRVPRDRNGDFDPMILKKYEKTLGPIEDKIISMYAKGMTTRDIQSHVQELYGIEISATLVSNITDKIIDKAKEWHNRPLEPIYTIVYFDAIHYKVKQDGKVITKAAYTCLSIDVEGRRDLLGIWIGENEGAHYWLGVLTEIKNRGVQDILITCVDGLNGFKDALETVFPDTLIQQCVIHQIRYTLKFIARKDKPDFLNNLRPVYQAPTLQAAELNLDILDEKWGKKYPAVIKSWRTNWNYLSHYFQFPEQIRKIIYTNNAVEALHRQFRKVSKNRAVFPNDDALFKLLFLAYSDISKNWIAPKAAWASFLAHFSLFFNDRIVPFL